MKKKKNKKKKKSFRHGESNPDPVVEIIHLLEENNIKPPSNDYEECLKESIKCHHNGVCNYISENLVTKNISKSKLDEVFVTSSIKHYNYAFFPNNLDNNSCFYSLCRYDYFIIVDILLKHQNIDIKKMFVI